jgi:hypothetical protein
MKRDKEPNTRALAINPSSSQGGLVRVSHPPLELGEWAEEARPLREAVFATPFNDERRKELREGLAPFIGGDVDGATREPWKLSTGYSIIDTRIDFEEGRFFYDWEKTRPPHICGVAEIYPPWPGINCNFKPLAVFGNLVMQGLQELANLAWHSMVSEFEERIKSGDIKLLARCKTPLAPLTELPWDVWQHFEVQHWNLGTAKCTQTDEWLFSVHVLEIRATKTPLNRRPPLDEDYQEFVSEATKRAGRGEPMTIKDAETWAKSKGLSREFARDARTRLDESVKLRPGQRRPD